MMEVELVREGSHIHFRGTGSGGHTVEIDGSQGAGGQNEGVRPMELLLMGLASCSAIDVILILRKQRIDPGPFKIKVEGLRKEGVPSPFSHILMRFLFPRGVDHERAGKAVSLAVKKYCSAAASLSEDIQLKWEVEILP